MKAKIKKKILFIVLICAGVISIGIITVHFSNQHLSKSELAQLRKQYPIYGPTISQELIDAFGKEAYVMTRMAYLSKVMKLHWFLGLEVVWLPAYLFWQKG